jgi:hypothetical protein
MGGDRGTFVGSSRRLIGRQCVERSQEASVARVEHEGADRIRGPLNKFNPQRRKNGGELSGMRHDSFASGASPSANKLEEQPARKDARSSSEQIRHRSRLGRCGGQFFASLIAVYRGIVAGSVAGLVGTWAMSEVQRLWTRVVERDPPESAGGKHDARDWQERSEHQNSNELAAQALARYVLGRRLTRDELRVAAPLMHYLFGAAMGAIYGAYAERRQADGIGAGFGTTVWLAADEIAMPFLGLSDSTAHRPVEMHLQSLFAHLVYGTATEMTRRSVQAHFDRAASQAA